jgi:hypothetical protein
MRDPCLSHLRLDAMSWNSVGASVAISKPLFSALETNICSG